MAKGMSFFEEFCASGVIRVGFQASTAPFSYSVGGRFEPIGYSVDLGIQVVQRIAEKFKIDSLKVVPVEVNSSNRSELLRNGIIDLECGSTTNTRERSKDCHFSHSVFFTSHRIVLKDSGCKKRESLQKLLITGISQSTSHLNLLKISPDELSLEFCGRPSISEAFQAFLTDPHIDGMIADEVILKSLLLGEKKNGFHFLPKSYGGEPYGFMIRKGEGQFKKEVDLQLAQIFSEVEFRALYEKWFLRELPFLGAALGIEISAEMEKLLLYPNDLGIS